MLNRNALLGAVVPLLAFALPAAAQDDDPIMFITRGATWKYLDNGVDPNAPPNFLFEWTEPGFDDDSWETGSAELGFGDNDEATVLDRGSPASTSFYFRHEFQVTASQLSDLEAGDGFYQLIFDLVRDDGAIVYVNGFEYYRSNVDDNQSGEHNTVAIGAVGGAAEDLFERRVVNGDLVLEVGTNVVAVSIHQSAPGSSDISFNLEMSAQKVAPTFGAYHPPVGIRFEDAGQALAFDPDPEAGDLDLGWEACPPNCNFGSQATGWGSVNQSDRFFDTPPGGFVNGYCFFNRNGTTFLQTQTQRPAASGDSELRYRVDLRNYRDVQVRFGVRSDHTLDAGDPPNNTGFEPSQDYIKYRHLVSEDGSSFDEIEVLNLTGDNSGGGVSFEPFPLVEETDMKRGLVPTQEIHDQIGDSWQNVGFDDSSWESFNLGVGYDSGPKYLPYIGWNTQTVMRNVNATCYMRIPFEVVDASVFNSLTLYMRDDDGYVVYINGNEVARNAAPGTVTWDSRATGNRNETLAEPLTPIEIDQHLDKLQNGTNILAVHCLNSSPGSSDFLVSTELTATLPNQAPRNDPPESLNDINFGTDGPFYYYTFPVDDSVNSYAFEAEFRTTELAESLFFDNWEITGTAIEVDGYDSWLQLETSLDPGEDGDRYADPDGDGIINLFEFAFGSDAEVNAITTESGQPIMPVVEFVEDGGFVYYEISWRQRDAATFGEIDFPYGGYATQGIRYIPQFSNDGEFWTDARFVFQGEEVGEAIDNGDGTLTYRFRYKDPVLQPGETEPFFGRLLVAPAPPLIEDGF